MWTCQSFRGFDGKTRSPLFEPRLIILFALACVLMNTLEFKHDLFHAAWDGPADCLPDVSSFRSRSTWKENKRSPSHV